MKLVYLFDPNTGEVTGTWNAQASPLEPGKFIEPEASTDIAPPPFGDKQIAVYDVAGGWSVVADHRGEVWFDPATREPVVVADLGVPAGLVSEQPPPPFAEQKDTELAGFRAGREVQLNRLTGIATSLFISGDTEGAQAAGAMRQGLLDVPDHATVNAATDLDGLREAIQGRLDALTAATPDRLREQFAKIFL